MTVAGVIAHPVTLVALQVVALKYSTLLLAPSATYTEPLGVVSTARAVGTDPDGRVTVASQVGVVAPVTL